MKKIKLDIVGLSYRHATNNVCILVLSDADQNRRIPIVIGSLEAQSIAVVLEQTQAQRPLTHDLFKKVGLVFGLDLVEVIINKFKDGIFYSILVFETNGERFEFDSRTSDAIALALRFECPIYTYESILQEVGIIFPDEENRDEEDDFAIPFDAFSDLSLFSEEKKEKKEFAEKDDFRVFLLEELETMLQQAIEEEDYDKASELHKEIEKRKKYLF
ncbi:MAG: bifunctional nuclease family protein [Lentimicrobiaceae bacterium]|jgi:bifunctional DNase/RNase|nr:bifunctional nuclease family protein [Lentimicrobiaceae bacterium]